MSPRRRLIQYLARYRRAFLTGFVCVVLATAINTGGPWVLKYAIDDLSQGLTFEKVRLYGALLFALSAVGGVFRFLMRRIIVGASRDFEYDLRNDFFAALQRLHLAYFQHHRTGDLMSRATSDLGAVRMMMGPAVMYTASTVLTFIVGIILMISIDPWLTLVALVPLPFVTVVVQVLRPRDSHALREDPGAALRHQRDHAGVAGRCSRRARLRSGSRSRSRSSARRTRSTSTRNRALIRLQGFYFPSMGLLMGIGALLVLWLGSRRVVAGQMTIGELVAFNAYLTMLGWPMIAFGWVSNLLQRGMASWKRLLEVLDAEPLVSDADANEAIQSIDGGDRVPESDVLIRRRRRASRHFASESRAGRRPRLSAARARASRRSSTCSRACTNRRRERCSSTAWTFATSRFTCCEARSASSPRSRSSSARRWRRTSHSVRAAIGGSGTASLRPQPSPVSTRTSPHFPQGYETTIGERGITLSGGQKQRVAIARALVVDPKILVLDDALSAVDTHTEEEILDRLSGVMAQRTSIIVSHRVSTVRDADQIVVLHEGRVAERGTHDELIRRDGFYADLYRKQLLEEELEAS